MPAFPSTLFELIESDNYTRILPYPVIRTPMDTGPPKKRRRFTAAVGRRQIALFCNETEKNLFDTFYAVDCFQGAGVFTMQDPESTTTKIVTFGFEGGPQVQIVENGLYYRITLNLEELPG